MRRILIMFAALAVSSCTSAGTYLKPMTAEQAARVRESCGRPPVSLLRGSESPHKVLYRACQRETLESLNTENEVTDAP
jgi:hypothetical protein